MDLFPFQFNLADSRMLMPMILEFLARDLETRAALLHPLRAPPSVARHQAMDVPNPPPFAITRDWAMIWRLSVEMIAPLTSFQYRRELRLLCAL
jgi:hypothetical protein